VVGNLKRFVSVWSKPGPLAFAGIIGFFFCLATLSESNSKKEVVLSNSPMREPSSKAWPSDWAWLQRTFPYGTADKTAHIEALRQAQSTRRLLKISAQRAAWQFAGPTNIGGRVSDLEFGPQNPNIVYAGAATGGVFKSTDRGETWTPIFDDQAVLPIGDIAVDPNRSNVVYVGTGEANGGHNNFPGAGVFKSTDAGATWALIGLERTTSIGRIVVDPKNSNRVFVAAIGSYFGKDRDRGVFRSTNAGQSWQQVLFVNDSTGAVDLVINPHNPSILFAALWERVRRPNTGTHLTGFSSGVYRSLDGGDTWERLGASHGLPGPDYRIGRIGLAICTTQPEHLYALYTVDNSYGGLYRSRDGGNTWVRTDPENGLQGGFLNFSWYFGNVRVHPNNPEQVYVLDVAFMGSFNGGQTWPINYGYRGPSNLHVDHHALAFDPASPQRLISGNDGGINISTDAGYSWKKVRALPITQFYHITMDQINPERLYGGTQDNGTMRTRTGRIDDWDIFYSGDGFYVIVDPNDPNIVYAERQFGDLSKSTNGGRSFVDALDSINTGEPTNWSTPVVMDPNNSRVLYYGTNRVYRTTNAAQFWRAISGNLTDGTINSRFGTITTIAVAPSNSGVIYAGTDDSHVWVTSDTGATWKEISGALPYRWVTRVTVDPTDERIAYATFSGLKWKSPQPHVFRTTDMGATWEDISNNLPDAPVNTIVVDPVYPNFLYAGTDVGAYYSSDYGKLWLPLGEGMPMVSVYDVVVHPKKRILAAGTHGRSMYTLDLSVFTNVEDRLTDEPLPPSSFTLAQNYPNPYVIGSPSRFTSISGTTIEFTLPFPTTVSLQIYNSPGQLVRSLLNDSREAGRHAASWDGKDAHGNEAASGVYFYRLQVGPHTLQKKMILIR
jgi:photosystem II stability/assembly factor-like uncharacterized protein